MCFDNYFTLFGWFWCKGIQTGDRLCHYQKSSIPRPVLNQFSSDFVLTLYKYSPLYVDDDGFCLESPIRSGNMSIWMIFCILVIFFGDFGRWASLWIQTMILKFRIWTKERKCPTRDSHLTLKHDFWTRKDWQQKDKCQEMRFNSFLMILSSSISPLGCFLMLFHFVWLILVPRYSNWRPFVSLSKKFNS